VLAQGAGVAAGDDVARVALVALAEDDLVRREVARHRHLRDLREVLAAQSLEDRDPAEQLDDVLTRGRHAAGGYRA
jgi:hypothetical protein